MTSDPQSETPLRDDEINCPGCSRTTDMSEFDEELDLCSKCLQKIDDAIGAEAEEEAFYQSLSRKDKMRYIVTDAAEMGIIR